MGIYQSASRMLGPIVGASMAMSFYSDARQKGMNPITSAGFAGLEAWAFTAFQWPLLGYQLAPLIDVGIKGLQHQATALGRSSVPNSPFGYQQDFGAAQTSRQRGVMAIMDSRLNARSSLGNEAGLFSARYR